MEIVYTERERYNLDVAYDICEGVLTGRIAAPEQIGEILYDESSECGFDDDDRKFILDVLRERGIDPEDPAASYREFLERL